MGKVLKARRRRGFKVEKRIWRKLGVKGRT